MVFAAFAEVLSLGSIFPFLGVLTSPSLIFDNHTFKPFVLFFGISKSADLLLPVTVLFSLAVLVAASMRILLIWFSNRLSQNIGSEISNRIYRITLYQPYVIHCTRSSNEIIDVIVNKAWAATNIINMVLVFISSMVMIIAILVVLVVVDPVIAMATFGGVGLIYSVIALLTRKRLHLNSQIAAINSTGVIKAIQEGIGGIRDVLIDGSQKTYCQIYRNSDQPLRKVQVINAFISASPRHGVEAFGMVLIAALAFYIANESEGITKAIPVLGALALGAQRMLPLVQQAYFSWSNIISGKASLQGTLEKLDQTLPEYADHPNMKTLPFCKNITLKQISFRYSSNSPLIIRNISLSITKGSRIGFIGETGSGKSTLLDIVMGLLQPTNGSIEIDGEPISMSNHRSWQKHVAHVPQAIFLADITIEENIAFGVPKEKIDTARVKQAAKQAQIAENIESLPCKYQTLVGERGIRLSGGQRQRIGIARALYKQADVIIFDEATSALDNETEQSVMNAIEGLNGNLTLLIIAHRLTTLKNCSLIVELEAGEIKRTGSYIDIVGELSRSHKKNSNS